MSREFNLLLPPSVHKDAVCINQQGDVHCPLAQEVERRARFRRGNGRGVGKSLDPSRLRRARGDLKNTVITSGERTKMAVLMVFVR
ncbi:unnamed protein product, partial [Iphiclides podalirius]